MQPDITQDGGAGGDMGFSPASLLRAVQAERYER
jgi:hypothetical protein